jgi:hypothetical protein
MRRHRPCGRVGVKIRLTAFLNHPSLLPKRDQLSRPAPYRFIVCAAGRRVVAHEGNDFFYMAVVVVPELDPKGSSRPAIGWLSGPI